MKMITMNDAKAALMRAVDAAGERKNQWLVNIIIIVLINLVGMALYFRLDLTRNNAYSLSKISKRVVSSLEEPLTVKVFFSKDLPAPVNTVNRYIADLLEEYKQAGNRNFRYEFVDVEKYKEAAAEYGIQPISLQELKSDRVSARSAHMGIALVHGDLIETVNPVIDPEELKRRSTSFQGIEYKITTLIQKMTGKVDALLRLGDRKIDVTLYASSSLQIDGMTEIDRKVAEKVRKSNQRNYDRLSFSYVDPDKDRKLLDLAEIYGFPKLQWPAFTSRTGKAVPAGEGMIGIVVKLGDRFETIHILGRTMFGEFAVAGLENLEESINNAVGNLVGINPKVGYITGHGERDISNPRENGAGTFRELIDDMYEFKVIDLSEEEIPADIQTIVINGPRGEFSDTDLFKIDQFLMQGKSALILLDSFNELQPDGQQNMFMREPMVLPVNTGLEKLAAHYGVTVNRDIVLDKSCYRQVQRGMGGMAEQYVYFLPLIDEQGLNRENPVTRHLRKIAFFKASSLALTEGAKDGMTRAPLVSSSDDSWLMQGRVNFNAWQMAPPRASDLARYTLAALVSGELPSYFANRPVPEDKDKAKDKGKAKDKSKDKVKETPRPADAGMKSPIESGSVLKKAVKPVKLIIAGTSEISTPMFVDKEGRAPNSVLLHNMVDYLSGNYDVPEMRSKGLEINPIKETGDNTKFMLKIFNIAGLPLLVILTGLVIWKRRAVRRQRILEAFAAAEAKDEK
jgi:ABC-2 type transport system permease protein